MSSLFIAPAAGPKALEHLDVTVHGRVSLTSLEGLSDMAIQLAGDASHGVAAWGTQPGADNINVSTWEAMQPGDWVLFYFDRQFPLCGRVLVCENSPDVAGRLWGFDEGRTWQYMYLMDEIREVDVPRPLALKALDYNENFYPRGFIRVNRDLDGRYGSVEQFLEQLAGAGHEFRRVVDAAKTGDEAGTAAAIDQVGSEMSEQAIIESVGSYTSSEAPEVQDAIVKRIKRNRKLVSELKALYEGHCQVCGFTFLKGDGTPYSEAAHITPISLLEADLDVKDNLVVLCPNHHKMLDYGALAIDSGQESDELVAIIDSIVMPLTNKHIGI
jgi:hypothetical protein